ncbi:MAG: thiamine pyrophosphate-dependent dehydrogenase E1 component subunit alpha [Hyphomonadaceae bacterium]|nr:thiamine pyrophosphate-dependent dehydrogenase E1 component subunit alpha [Hyphomonadaceae bacterium]MBC6412040.1 thiamine pyrophosphate-dependent dehydrogenase E1 component subunit alpha [Hyphomonadaceae bacterium]
MQQSKEQLLDAYRQMKTIREFEERLHREIMTGEIAGFTHLYSGQEAVAVGVCQHLDSEDLIVSTHRGHGHCIAKGCDVIDMMAEIYGRQTGLGKGKGGSMHIADFDKGMLGANGVVGAGGPLAVGAALSAKLDGRGRVGICFAGEGSINQGAVFEAMNMAKVINAPAVFAIEINGYSEHTGASYSVGGIDIANRTAGFGLKTVETDGCDYHAVYDAMAELLDHARAGNGPCAAVFRTTRFFGHFEGDPQKYRARDEVKQHRLERDCLKTFRARVVPVCGISETELDAIDADVLALIDAAVDRARAAPATPIEEMEADVYVSYQQDQP